MIKGFPGWAALRSIRLRAVYIGLRIALFLAILGLPAYVLAKPRRPAPPLQHSTALSFIRKDSTCVEGPITAITPKSVTVQPPGKPAVLITRDSLRQVSQNGSILFSSRTSWGDVKAVHLLPRESFTIRLRNGKIVKGKPYRVEDDAIVFKHGWWPRKVYSKSAVATVDYLRIKPDAYGFDYFTQEAPALLFFYPEFYDRLKGLEGRVPVRLYDAVQPEDDSTLKCAQQ